MAGEAIQQNVWDSLSEEEQEALKDESPEAFNAEAADTSEDTSEGSTASEGEEASTSEGTSESAETSEGSETSETSETSQEETQTGSEQDEKAGTAETETSTEEAGPESSSEETAKQAIDAPVFSGDQQTQPEESQQTREESTEGAETGEQKSETQQRIEQIPEEISQLNQKFDDGEIGFTEYLDQRDALRQEQTRLEVLPEVEKTYEQREAEKQQQSLQQQWRDDVTDFTQNEAPDILQDIDTYNKWVELTNAKLDNADYDGLSNKEILRESAKETRAIRGLSDPNAQDQTQENKAAEARKGANQSRKDEAEQTQSLSGVPEAAASEGSPDKFTYLDQLMENDPEKFETEIAKLSETERDEYARR